MDELVKLVADKVGISEAQAQQAVEIVLSFLKETLIPTILPALILKEEIDFFAFLGTGF